jgi:hypothetical protein
MKAFFQFAALAMFSFAGGYALSNIPWSSSNTPSWVQAVGSIVAIGIAIWVPYWQKRQAQQQARIAESEQVRHLLRNLLDEMIVVSESFGARNGKLLMDVPAGEPFSYVIPIVERPFPIYDASTARLGQVPNDDLRRLIIMGYGHANSFVGSIRLNNILIERFEQADYMASVHGDQIHKELRDARLRRLAQYGDSLKASYTVAIDKMQKMQTSIKEELGLI